MYFYLICQFSPSRDAPRSSFIWCLLESALVILENVSITIPICFLMTLFGRLSLGRMVYSKSNSTNSINPTQNVSDSDNLYKYCRSCLSWKLRFSLKKEVSPVWKAIDKAFRQVVVSDGLKDRRNLLLYCKTPTFSLLLLYKS